MEMSGQHRRVGSSLQLTVGHRGYPAPAPMQVAGTNQVYYSEGIRNIHNNSSEGNYSRYCNTEGTVQTENVRQQGNNNKTNGNNINFSKYKDTINSSRDGEESNRRNGRPPDLNEASTSTGVDQHYKASVEASIGADKLNLSGSTGVSGGQSRVIYGAYEDRGGQMQRKTPQIGTTTSASLRGRSNTGPPDLWPSNSLQRCLNLFCCCGLLRCCWIKHDMICRRYYPSKLGEMIILFHIQ
ncbi:unnamed protein product [Protopolystoma xenopodis]|uniref:Uncharacterized protein n=1 Tax=Protopolystoma xenopodis TaxID=117903 RepID=A0A448X5F4_9PLAT|nr:unnamed protein product [Protopolystoma xenopodis]